MDKIREILNIKLVDNDISLVDKIIDYKYQMEIAEKKNLLNKEIKKTYQKSSSNIYREYNVIKHNMVPYIGNEFITENKEKCIISVIIEETDKYLINRYKYNPSNGECHLLYNN
jgi:hypothetical protein